jgi:hypothetical protein
MTPQLPAAHPPAPEEKAPPPDPHEPGWIGFAVLIAVGFGAVLVGERFGVVAAFAAAVAVWTVVALATRLALRRWTLPKVLWRSVPHTPAAPLVVATWFSQPWGRPHPDTPYFVWLAEMIGAAILTGIVCLMIDWFLARAFHQSDDGSRLGA